MYDVILEIYVKVGLIKKIYWNFGLIKFYLVIILLLCKKWCLRFIFEYNSYKKIYKS